MTLSPPVPKDWTARYDPTPADFNTYIRDTFNFLTGPPKLRVVANATQSGIATTTWTTLVLQSVTEDTYSGWTSGSQNYYAAPVQGWYSITLFASLAMAANNVARVGLQYQLSGTMVGPFEFDQSESGLNPWSWDCYDEVFLNAGDRIYPQVFHEATGSISTSLTNPSSLEIVWWGL